MNRSIAQLRHLYDQMVNGHVKDTKEAALGLLGPVIEELEKYKDKLEKTENYLSRFVDHTYVCLASDGDNCDCPDIEINEVRRELDAAKSEIKTLRNYGVTAQETVESLQSIVDKLTYDHHEECRGCLRLKSEEHGPHCGIDRILNGN